MSRVSNLSDDIFVGCIIVSYVVGRVYICQWPEDSCGLGDGLLGKIWKIQSCEEDVMEVRTEKAEHISLVNKLAHTTTRTVGITYHCLLLLSLSLFLALNYGWSTARGGKRGHHG